MLDWIFFAETSVRWAILKTLDGLFSKGIRLGPLRSFRDRNEIFKNKSEIISETDLFKFYGKENHIKTFISGKVDYLPACHFISPAESKSKRITLRWNDEKRILSRKVSSFTEPLLDDLRKSGKKRNHLFDGEPFCINKIEFHDNEISITFSRCSYFDSLRTHFSPDIILEGTTLRRKLLNDSHQLPQLGSEDLTWHMGVVGMTETSDNKLIFQLRSRFVANRPNSISASFSGTIEGNDLLELESDQDGLNRIIQSLNRECLKELGVHFYDKKSPPIFLGGIREYYRLGFPDFYFYSHIEKSSTSITKEALMAEERSEFHKLIFFDFNSRAFLENPRTYRSAFDSSVKKIADELRRRGNITAIIGISLLYEELIRQSDN